MKKPKLPKILKRSKKNQAPQEEIVEGVPRITNETVAAHREEVLGSARKYIYPLQHSKHKVVLFTTAIVIAAVVAFFSYCTLALYRFKSNNGFLYGVTQVVPFPIAKAGGSYVSYENYLFELRHYIHYYETQQKLDFSSASGKQQLDAYKQRALDKVIDDVYIKRLAAKHHVSVSDQEVNSEIAIVRSQNKLGNTDKTLEDVLRDNFGWSLNDFKRSLKQQMLAQKVVAVLDTATQKRAQTALNELHKGADFATVAKKYSDDTATKDKGGDFGFWIDKSNRDLAPQTTQALFGLKAGQLSGIINSGYSLEIVKVNKTQGGKVLASHILFNFKGISSYINDLKDTEKPKIYIKL